MITLYNKTESNFNHNGLAVLDGNILNPVVSEELNGLFSFDSIIQFMLHTVRNCCQK